jgi:imidazolonepropionase-like amidohydrolase
MPGEPAWRTVSPMVTTTDVQTSRRLTVIHAAWLFDGAGSSLTPDPAVLVEAGQIKAVETRTAAIPPAADVIDLGGATLLPGLVDSHVHLCLNASEDPVRHLADMDDEALLEEMAAAARRALVAGVTTVRDLGDRGYLALRLREQPTRMGPLPTIVAAGPPITTPGGHCHFLGGAASGTVGIRAAVAERAERGADVIKVMASGGNLTRGSCPHQPQFGPQDLRVAVDEAHRRGLPLTAHAHSARSVADAVAAGADGIEHATFMTAGGVHAPDDLICQIAALRITIGATVARRPETNRRPPPAIAGRIEGIRDSHRRLHEAGAIIVASSDAGASPAMPHDALPWAPTRLAELGFSPAEALWAITSRSAQVCGLGHRKGRIAPGFDADILAIDGNPLDDLTAIRRPRAVYSGGRAILPALGGQAEVRVP